ncbi:MAG: hypothetical protein DRI01_06380 [Chloroflexi bacterium]|nr:MAG: hypothetical protein DRI01_06380 [Chloroflexota bacterium]
MLGCQTSSPASLPQDEFLPERKLEFEIQGLVWRTIAYYYHPGIYEEVYDDVNNTRLLPKARNVGANYLLVRAFYSSTREGNLVGNTGEAEKYLKRAITAAHDQGFKIFLTPFVESMEFWPERKWHLSVDEWTDIVLYWARFAEENGVELFTPGFEMALIMDKFEAKDWFRDILHQIKTVYHGKVAFAEIPYGEQWELLDENRVFDGYDAAGITIFPWKDYDGVQDMRSFEDLGRHVEEQARKLNELGKRYNTEFQFVATLGMDFWQGEEPDPATRAQGYEVCLDILKQYGVTGVFLHKWASEPDHLGRSTAVEDTLEARWIQLP